MHCDRRQATLWRRGDGEEWIVRDFVGAAEIPLRLTTAPIPLDELYAPLDLER